MATLLTPRNQLDALPLQSAAAIGASGDITALPNGGVLRYFSPAVTTIDVVIRTVGTVGSWLGPTELLDVSGCSSFMFLLSELVQDAAANQALAAAVIYAVQDPPAGFPALDLKTLPAAQLSGFTGFTDAGAFPLLGAPPGVQYRRCGWSNGQIAGSSGPNGQILGPCRFYVAFQEAVVPITQAWSLEIWAQ